MAPPQHLLPPLLLVVVVVVVVVLGPGRAAAGRSSPISDLKSKISGVEELLEEFRKQLQQDQAYRSADAAAAAAAADSCVGDFGDARGSIIRAKVSIEQGAAFLQAPEPVYTWRACLHACCALPHCTVAVVQEDPRRAGDSLRCYLFNCTYRGQQVCSFAPQQGFTAYTRAAANASLGQGQGQGQGQGHLPAPPRRTGEEEETQEVDEPPRSDAGQDVVIQLPTDWAVLDGRDSVDDVGIGRYEWTLVKGDTAINMKSTHPGLLKVSGLQEGVYTFQMTVTDTAGQRSSDNVSVTVLAPKHQAEVCTGHCSHYQFKCDDGCCIDISYACDGKQHCPDRSDEKFCTGFEGGRKSVTHPVDPPREDDDPAAAAAAPLTRKTIAAPQDAGLEAPPQSAGEQKASTVPCEAAPVVGPCKGSFPRWFYDRNAGACRHFLYGGCQGNHNNFLQEADCVSECIQTSPSFRPASVAPAVTKQTEIAAPEPPQARAELDATIAKPFKAAGGHPVPESGAILPLALGIVITALLLLMIGCRLRLVRHKLKKARPLTTEESDYLINGMYL